MKTNPFELNLNDLETIASDGAVRAPEGLRDEISRNLDLLAFVGEESRPRRAFRTVAGIAAAVALAFCVGFGVGSHGRPKDTFTDPYLAYSQLEDAFTLISSKMDRGVTLAIDATDQVVEKTNEIMKKI